MITYDAPTRIEEDNQAINNLISAKPFLLNQLLVQEDFLFANSTYINFQPKYANRPDLVAYEQYGITAYYPIILFANNIGSLFQFSKDKLNNQIIVPNFDFVQKYLI
jgi:hypothetical protein